MFLKLAVAVCESSGVLLDYLKFFCLTHSPAGEHSVHYFRFEWKYFTVRFLCVLSVIHIKVQ